MIPRQKIAALRVTTLQREGFPLPNTLSGIYKLKRKRNKLCVSAIIIFTIC
jgi:hypothetical protein